MKGVTEGVLAADSIADRRRMFLGIAAVGLLFGFGSTAQTMLMLESPPMQIGGVEIHPFSEAAIRLSLNAFTALLLAIAAVLLRVHDRRLAIALPLALGLSVVVAVLRTLLQMIVGVFPWGLDSPAIPGTVIVVPVGFVLVLIGMTIVTLSRRARGADRARLEASVRAGLALEELQNEELRVRREVADTLHGTMQHRFVLLESSIRRVAERLGQAPPASELPLLGANLLDLSRELDELREGELRHLSAALYPESLDRGLVPATRALVARIPRTIPVAFTSSGVPTPDVLDRAARLLMVRVVEEGISNALRHGRADRIELSLSVEPRLDAGSGARVSADRYVAEVRHHGYEPPAERTLSGLARLGTRLAEHGGEISLIAEPGGGVLRASIPVAA